MVFEQLDHTIQAIGATLWSWPLLFFIGITGVVFTIALNFIQFRYFVTAWRYVIHPEKGKASNTITPLQAFMNTLSASVGNGSLVGMATALYSGGPGATFWVFLLGFITMPIRFAEVWCGLTSSVRLRDGVVRGGPMAYIYHAPGGKILAPLYVIFCLLLTFASGCAMQCQSITGGLVQVTGWSPCLFAGLLFGLLVYILLGGARRILKVSDMIVPVKVVLFFVATVLTLFYNSGALLTAIKTIVAYALTPQAVRGALLGYTIQDAIRFGLARALNATEACLGTAGILYGATGSSESMKNGITSMITAFVSNHLVCTVLMVLIVASGAWDSGLNGINMTAAAYSTFFGAWGPVVVTTLSIMFGLGVLVAYLYIGRECWSFLTEGRYLNVYGFVYCFSALLGSLANLSIVWNLVDISNAGLISINLYALWYMLPRMRHALRAYRASHAHK